MVTPRLTTSGAGLRDAILEHYERLTNNRDRRILERKIRSLVITSADLPSGKVWYGVSVNLKLTESLSEGYHLFATAIHNYFSDIVGCHSVVVKFDSLWVSQSYIEVRLDVIVLP